MSYRKYIIALFAVLIFLSLSILIRYSQRHHALSLILSLGGEYLLENETADSRSVISRHSNKTPEAWDAFQKVFAINLANTKVTNDELTEVALINEIKHLWIGNTEINDDSADTIAQFHSLVGLRVEDTQLTKEGIDKTRDSNTKLIISLRHAH